MPRSYPHARLLRRRSSRVRPHTAAFRGYPLPSIRRFVLFGSPIPGRPSISLVPRTSHVPDDVFDSPRLFPLDYDLKSGSALFLPMSRAAYAEHSFLDTRLGPDPTTATRLTLGALLGAHAQWQARPDTEANPARYIFHTAFCASTLLARCLDHRGATLALKEPLSLHRVSAIQRNRLAGTPGVAHITDEQWGRLLALTVDLLARTFDPDAHPLIKTTDSTNHIATDLLAHNPDSRAILLYSDLPTFLIATLKAPRRRAYARQLLWRARTDAANLGLFQHDQLPPDPALTDAQAATLVWTIQIHLYRAIIARDTEHDTRPRVRTLDAATFTNAPSETLRAAADHFEIGLDESHIAHALEHTMTRHAKNPGSPFVQARANDERADLEARLAPEMREAASFFETLCAHHPLDVSLPRPLL